jgi:hypothetical protein
MEMMVRWSGPGPVGYLFILWSKVCGWVGVGVQVDYNVVHLRTSLVQLFVLLLQNFEKLVQMIELKRFGGAPNGYPLAPLGWCELE